MASLVHGFIPRCWECGSSNSWRRRLGWKLLKCAAGLAVLGLAAAAGAQDESVHRTLEALAAKGRSGPTDPKGIDLGALQVRLWYTGTGRLSENIAPPAKFEAWNTVIGEGQAQEPADDALVTVDVIATSGGEENIGVPLTIIAHDAKGKVLGQRRVTDILTSHTGHAVQALWLRDVTCAGTVIVEAVIGPVKKATRVNLSCGE